MGVAFGANAQDDVQAIIKQKSDSLSETFGKAYGASIAGVYERQEGLSKTDFLNGFNSIMSADLDNRSYSEGLEVAMGFLKTMSEMERNQGIKLNREKFVTAFIGQMTAEHTLSNEEVMALNQKLQNSVKETADLVQANDPVVKAGAAYADEAIASRGFKKTDSGLVYKVEKVGNGKNFASTDRVRLNYKGMHVDGSVFDQSTDTVTLGVSQVVPGFKEALQMMSPGSKMTVIIPGELGYGKRGAGNGAIKPNETLVFDIETYGIEPPKKEPAINAPGKGGAVNSDRRNQPINPNKKTVAPRKKK